MNSTQKTSLLLIIICFLVIFSPSNILANGIIAVWDMGSATQPPYPVKNSMLELENANVVFRNGKITATYRVRNPSYMAIDVTLGLPLEHSIYAKERQERQERNKNLLDSFKLRVNGEDPGASWLTEDGKSEYPLVVNWLMTFPGGSSTEIIINYPSNIKAGSFKFITKTGALWGKPIDKMTFSYCGRDVAAFGKSGSVWTDDGWTIKRTGIDAEPKPFDYDEGLGCIVWRRSEWQPRSGMDTFSIQKGDSTASYKYPWAYDAKFGSFYESSMAKWCHPGKDRVPFAETLNLDSVDFSSLDPDELTTKSYIFMAGTSEKCRNGKCDSFYNLPEHLATDYRLWLMRYLRNSIAARHGHQFKDPALKECFKAVKIAKTAISPIEKRNTAAIYKIEKELKKQNTAAWTLVRKNSGQ